MTRFHRPAAFLAPLLVGVAAAIVSAWLISRSGGPDRDAWYWPLLSPGIVGFALAGGVHGGASGSALAAAWGLATGIAWAAVAALALWLGRRLAPAAERSGDRPLVRSRGSK